MSTQNMFTKMCKWYLYKEKETVIYTLTELMSSLLS